MWLWTLKTSPNGIDSEQATLETEDEDAGDEEDDESPAKPAKGGFSLELNAARKIAQGLGAHLEDMTSVVEIKGQTARLLPVGERVKALFGKDQGKAPSAPRKSRGRAGFLKGMEDVRPPTRRLPQWRILDHSSQVQRCSIAFTKPCCSSGLVVPRH